MKAEQRPIRFPSPRCRGDTGRECASGCPRLDLAGERERKGRIHDEAPTASPGSRLNPRVRWLSQRQPDRTVAGECEGRREESGKSAGLPLVPSKKSPFPRPCPSFLRRLLSPCLAPSLFSVFVLLSLAFPYFSPRPSCLHHTAASEPPRSSPLDFPASVPPWAPSAGQPLSLGTAHLPVVLASLQMGLKAPASLLVLFSFTPVLERVDAVLVGRRPAPWGVGSSAHPLAADRSSSSSAASPFSADSALSSSAFSASAAPLPPGSPARLPPSPPEEISPSSELARMRKRALPAAGFLLPVSLSSGAQNAAASLSGGADTLLGASSSAPAKKQSSYASESRLFSSCESSPYCVSVSATERLPTRTMVVGRGAHAAPLHEFYSSACAPAASQAAASKALGSWREGYPVLIGGAHPLVVQTMTNSDTRDVNATVEQARRRRKPKRFRISSQAL
ncbi:zinc finger, C3HC4 type (RING finger) domain-containing protein [Besnoitia besnoiti]|uniref:Zinc finger, C3HC4 type (RING finger) domain-containing protein n=1 Tax=Besnoitia besnoiti TaxID=94643 RepID=A0A2A9MH34_BESBE|nr:zinc finger, C3HC4 type (RING finger) domain-containing protein [Besnoitia besnoiti]PFH37838.1 zinc finger, C3HC4 type (RING finger) domain-containing protein [Besnoitia besnoiti]